MPLELAELETRPIEGFVMICRDGGGAGGAEDRYSAEVRRLGGREKGETVFAGATRKGI